MLLLSFVSSLWFTYKSTFSDGIGSSISRFPVRYFVPFCVFLTSLSLSVYVYIQYMSYIYIYIYFVLKANLAKKKNKYITT